MKLTKGMESIKGQDGIWRYWVDDDPSETEKPDYFDMKAGDLCDENPVHMIGRKVEVYRGTWLDYVWAEFRVSGFDWRYLRPPSLDNPHGLKKLFPKLKRTTEWDKVGNPVTLKPSAPQPAQQFVSARGTVRWNPGKKLHQVLVDNKVVFESADKDAANEVALGNKELAA